MAGVVDEDFGFRALIQRIRGLDGIEGTVGIQGAEASQVREGGTTNLKIAQVHEFGAPNANIPQRSFLRSTFDENERKYERELERGAGSVVDGKSAVAAVLRVTEIARADVLDKINSNIPPPLSDATIARKGDALALVDTGQLFNSITAKVSG